MLKGQIRERETIKEFHGVTHARHNGLDQDPSGEECEKWLNLRYSLEVRWLTEGLDIGYEVEREVEDNS